LSRIPRQELSNLLQGYGYEPHFVPRWPMIVLMTPKGWTGPKDVEGKQIEGTFRAHQVPIADIDKPEHLLLLEQWMRSPNR
jgi:xylulose-5-phosphate/fructose-6-phosphate phosphoketolase